MSNEDKLLRLGNTEKLKRVYPLIDDHIELKEQETLPSVSKKNDRIERLTHRIPRFLQGLAVVQSPPDPLLLRPSPRLPVPSLSIFEVMALFVN